MDRQLQTSFIPKETMVAPAPSRGGAMGLVTMVAVILFVLALGSWGAVFFYKKTLDAELVTLRASLNRAKESFEPGLLEEFEKTERKLKVANTLLNSHSTLIPLFNFIEERTLQGVRFKNFQYTTGASSPDGGGGIQVKMSGEAPSYASIASQAKAFDSEYIRNPIFSNLNLDSQGRVVFDVSFFVSPELISYRRVANVK